jgi:hypothetical protein
MNVREMKEEFLILYDKITNFDAPGCTDFEIATFLNKAQERLVLHIINPAGNKYLAGFEVTEKRRKDLNELHRNAEITTRVNTPDNKPNGEFFQLPADFLYAINEEVEITSLNPCYNNTRPEVKPITHDQYNKIIKNPFKKPYGGLILRLDWNSTVPQLAGRKAHELITDGNVVIQTYVLRYLKRPVEMVIDTANPLADVSCELNDYTHRWIVDEAVAIATGVTNPEQYQIKLREAQASE